MKKVIRKSKNWFTRALETIEKSGNPSKNEIFVSIDKELRDSYHATDLTDEEDKDIFINVVQHKIASLANIDFESVKVKGNYPTVYFEIQIGDILMEFDFSSGYRNNNREDKIHYYHKSKAIDVTLSNRVTKLNDYIRKETFAVWNEILLTKKAYVTLDIGDYSSNISIQPLIQLNKESLSHSQYPDEFKNEMSRISSYDKESRSDLIRILKNNHRRLCKAKRILNEFNKLEKPLLKSSEFNNFFEKVLNADYYEESVTHTWTVYN